MNGPGGRATPGLEAAIALLAQGAERSRVLREALGAALRASQATHALLVAPRIGDPVVLAAIGTGSVPLEAATREALAGGPSRRSDPVVRVNAAATPVWSGSRVVAAIGVAGPADTLDPTPLDTAVDLVALALQRPSGEDAVGTAAELCVRLTDVHGVDEAVAGILEAVSTFTGLPAFVCVEEEGRLRVSRFHGLERDRLSTLVAGAEFRSLVKQWRAHGGGAPVTLPADGGEVLGCAPIGRVPWHGLVGVVESESAVGEALPNIAASATLAARGLDRISESEEAARRDRQVDTLINTVTSPLVIVDGDGGLVRANPPAVEVFGLSGTFDRGRDIVKLAAHDALGRLVAAGEGEAEVTLGTPGRQYLARVRSFADTGHRAVVLTDLSAERESTRLRNEFVSVMGHELRTPLTVVKGTLQTITRRGAEMKPEDQSTLLESALRQATHLEHLIEDLLLVSTEATGRPPLNTSSADALEVVGDTVDLVAAGFPDREVDVLAMGGDTTLSTDTARLGQVVRHLVDNALKHTAGPVTVEVAATADTVEVTVADQGDGIFSGDLERMFEPFVQGDSSSTRTSGGTGIGLYLARRLVEAMGGRIDCDSRLGQGTRFAVRLPRNTPAGRPMPRSREVTATRDHASS